MVVNASFVDCVAVSFTVVLDIFDDRADSVQAEVAWDEQGLNTTTNHPRGHQDIRGGTALPRVFPWMCWHGVIETGKKQRRAPVWIDDADMNGRIPRLISDLDPRAHSMPQHEVVDDLRCLDCAVAFADLVVFNF